MAPTPLAPEREGYWATRGRQMIHAATSNEARAWFAEPLPCGLWSRAASCWHTDDKLTHETATSYAHELPRPLWIADCSAPKILEELGGAFELATELEWDSQTAPRRTTPREEPAAALGSSVPQNKLTLTAQGNNLTGRGTP
eukprot:g6051.t1